MAYTPGIVDGELEGGLVLVSSANGFGLYRYDSLDTIQSVDAGGYFNNVDDNLNLVVGDIIEVVSWSTAVRTGTIFDVSRTIVLSVDSAGAVSTSGDIYVPGIVSSQN